MHVCDTFQNGSHAVVVDTTDAYMTRPRHSQHPPAPSTVRSEGAVTVRPPGRALDRVSSLHDRGQTCTAHQAPRPAGHEICSAVAASGSPLLLRLLLRLRSHPPDFPPPTLPPLSARRARRFTSPIREVPSPCREMLPPEPSAPPAGAAPALPLAPDSENGPEVVAAGTPTTGAWGSLEFGCVDGMAKTGKSSAS